MKKIYSSLRFFVITVPFIFTKQSSLYAQICTGSLGDPVVNVTFGSGANPGPMLPSGTTTYTFTSSICPNDGSYTIVNGTFGCFGNSWLTYNEDHTPGDVNGYMMLVNASVNPGVFYVDTVKNLCANTKYEFATWLTNVILPTSCNGVPNKPKLTFNIETTAGVVLSTYNTGDISETSNPVWKQYGFFFTTPAASSTVVIRITNNAPGGCGNDLALDDITFRPCGPTVTAASANSNQSVIDICNGDTAAIALSATVSSGYTSPAYQWQLSTDGINWTDIALATTLTYIRNATGLGVYKYRLTVAESTNIGISNCRVASNSITITIHNLPDATADNNGPLCENSTISLSAAGGSTYIWNGPAGFTSTQANPSFIATGAAGVYTVSVSDQFGCKDTATTMVSTFPLPAAVVSNTQQICIGDSAVLVASGGNSYSWLPVSGLSNAIISNPMASPTTSNTYTVTVTGNNNCTDTASVLVVVNTRPIVTIRTANGNQSFIDICSGDTAAIALSASVSSGYKFPAYQWQVSTDSINWTNIAGATALNYNRTATGMGIYKYRLIVAESNGNKCLVVSNTITVTIHNLPVATAVNNGPVCDNDTIILTATGGATYSWTGPAGFTSAQANPSFTGTNAAGLYTVTAVDLFGCKDTTTTLVSTFPIPAATVSNTQQICIGDSVALVARGGNSYSWMPVTGLSNATISNPMAAPGNSTTYTVTVIGNNNCTDTASVLVVVNIKPIVNAGADKIIIKGQSVILDGSITNPANVSYTWTPGLYLNDAGLLAPVSTAPFNINYVLNATSTIGCGITTDTMLLKVFNDFYIPNAFSPNGDGVNDTWRIEALAAFPAAVITVYDRFGKKVYESTTNKVWDGKMNNTALSAGAYAYVIDLKNNRPVLKGMVVIVR